MPSQLYPNANTEIITLLQEWSELARSGQLESIAIAGVVNGEPVVQMSSAEDSAKLYVAVDGLKEDMIDFVWGDGEE